MRSPIFTVSNGRSGTAFLARFFKKNVQAHVCHEPYFDLNNPTLFGVPIFHAGTGELERVRPIWAAKARRISQLLERHAVYIECNHALVKAADRLLLDSFPEARFIHLVRHPLQTARSAANREAFIHRLRLPWRHYTTPEGQRRFRWSLIGREGTFAHVQMPITRFQFYLLEWFEIELRIMRLQEKTHVRDSDGRWFCLRAFGDFKKADLSAAIDALGLHRWRKDLYIPPITNRTPFYRTQVGERDWSEFQAIIDSLPDDVVAKFHREPYISCPWFESLALPNPCATTYTKGP